MYYTAFSPPSPRYYIQTAAEYLDRLDSMDHKYEYFTWIAIWYRHWKKVCTRVCNICNITEIIKKKFTKQWRKNEVVRYENDKIALAKRRKEKTERVLTFLSSRWFRLYRDCTLSTRSSLITEYCCLPRRRRREASRRAAPRRSELFRASPGPATQGA